MINADLKGFFQTITNSKALQKRLCNSKTLSEVSDIATEYSFIVSATELLKAQAGRIIELSVLHPEEALIAVRG